MADESQPRIPTWLIAIDIGKKAHAVLIEDHEGKRQPFKPIARTATPRRVLVRSWPAQRNATRTRKCPFVRGPRIFRLDRLWAGAAGARQWLVPWRQAEEGLPEARIGTPVSRRHPKDPGPRSSASTRSTTSSR